MPTTQKPSNQKSPEEFPPEVIPSKELKILYSWKAPSRPFKKKDREFWTTIIAILVLVSLILFFVKEWFLIATLFSLAFVYYVLSTVPPEEIEYKITNRGLIYAGEDYPYELIQQFWFSEKYGQKVVNFEPKSGFFGRLTLLVGQGDEKKIREILSRYLIEEEVKPGFLDKAGLWLQNKISFESKNPSNSKT